MYFYATRKDKNGNKLVTSYGKQAQAEKYGGAGANISKDMFYLSEEGLPSKEEGPLVLRSKLECIASEAGQGRFVLYAQEGDRFIPTAFRFESYGAANTGMKSLAPVMGTLLVVEDCSGGMQPVVHSTEAEYDSPF